MVAPQAGPRWRAAAGPCEDSASIGREVDMAETIDAARAVDEKIDAAREWNQDRVEVTTADPDT